MASPQTTLAPDLEVDSAGEVKRRQRVGGMLNYYYRDAA